MALRQAQTSSDLSFVHGEWRRRGGRGADPLSLLGELGGATLILTDSGSSWGWGLVQTLLCLVLLEDLPHPPPSVGHSGKDQHHIQDSAGHLAQVHHHFRGLEKAGLPAAVKAASSACSFTSEGVHGPH